MLFIISDILLNQYSINNTKQSKLILLGLVKIACYIRHFVVSDLFIYDLLFHQFQCKFSLLYPFLVNFIHIWDLSCWNINVYQFFPSSIIIELIFNTFDHNFKNIPLYIMSNVSLERYYFVLYDGALTLKMSKMALNAFCDKGLFI